MVLLLSTVSSFRMPSNFRRNFHCIITNYFLRKLIGIICFLLEGMDKLGLLTIQRRCCPDWSMVTNNHLYELKIREIKYFNQKKKKEILLCMFKFSERIWLLSIFIGNFVLFLCDSLTLFFLSNQMTVTCSHQNDQHVAWTMVV